LEQPKGTVTVVATETVGEEGFGHVIFATAASKDNIEQLT
jgi:hypothetical protein